MEINNRPVGAEISSMSAYIQQEDLFVGTLTVREHLTFQVNISWHVNVVEDGGKEESERIEE